MLKFKPFEDGLRASFMDLHGDECHVTGWVNSSIHLGVTGMTHVSLTRDLARDLGQALLNFADTGDPTKTKETTMENNNAEGQKSTTGKRIQGTVQDWSDLKPLTSEEADGIVMLGNGAHAYSLSNRFRNLKPGQSFFIDGARITIHSIRSMILTLEKKEGINLSWCNAINGDTVGFLVKRVD